MVENRPILDFLTHLVLILGIVIVAFPVYVALIASTHYTSELGSGLMPLLPGAQLLEQYHPGAVRAACPGLPPFWLMVWNSLMMAVHDHRGQDRHLDHLGLCHRLFPLSAAARWRSGSSSSR